MTIRSEDATEVYTTATVCRIIRVSCSHSRSLITEPARQHAFGTDADAMVPHENIVVEGVARVELQEVTSTSPCVRANVVKLGDTRINADLGAAKVVFCRCWESSHWCFFTEGAEQLGTCRSILFL